MRRLEGGRLFPASASNDPGELSKLALHAHYCPLRPLIAMHRVKRQDHAHVASYLKEVHAEATRRGYSFDGSKIGRSTGVRTRSLKIGRAHV